MHIAAHEHGVVRHRPIDDGVCITAPCGCVVVLDTEGFCRLDNRSLSIGSHGYAQLWAGKVVLLHRWLMGLDVGHPMTVDHVNRDKLDNRFANLRVCTRAENNQNRRARRVYRTRSGRYEAKVQVDGVRHWLGSFATQAEAQQAVAVFQSRVQHPFLAA